MGTDLELALDERVVFRSKRGGVAAHPGWLWLVLFIVGSQGCGAMMTVGFLFDGESSRNAASIAMSVGTVVACVALLVAWIRFKRGPAYFATDRKVSARRFLRAPLVIDMRNIAGASRI